MSLNSGPSLYNDGDSVSGTRCNLDFDKLYRDYCSELCSRLRRSFGTGPPDPEDAAQAAFAKFAALEDRDRIRNPRAFLLTTARNIILDHKRSEGRHFNYAQSVLAEHTSFKLDELTPERVVIEKERFDIVRRAIDTLPHKQQVVLGLSRRRGYTYMQIVEETGWSYGDVYRHMNMALATLADALKRG